MKSNLPPRVNAIMVLGASIGLIALLLPWLLFKPNRLVPGSARSLWQLEPFWALVLLGCWFLLLMLSFVRLPARGVFYSVLVALAALSGGFLIGGSTNSLLKDAGEIARVSISGGAWLTLVAIYVASFAAKLEFRFAWLGPLLGFLLPLLANQFINLGPVVEYRGVQDQFAGQLAMHLALAISSVVTASIIGFPLGVLASRNARLEGLILGGAGLLQTIPSLALFGILLPPLAWLECEARVGVVLGLVLFVGLSGAGLLALARVLKARVFKSQALKARALAVPAWMFMGFAGAVFLAAITVMLFSALTGDSKALSAWVRPNALLGSASIRGIGAAPALFALTLYPLLPLVVNPFGGQRLSAFAREHPDCGPDVPTDGGAVFDVADPWFWTSGGDFILADLWPVADRPRGLDRHSKRSSRRARGGTRFGHESWTIVLALGTAAGPALVAGRNSHQPDFDHCDRDDCAAGWHGRLGRTDHRWVGKR